MKHVNRILALAMALVMLVGMCSMAAFAAEANVGTLQLNRPADSSIDMTTKTFKLYRIFNGVASTDGEITYEWNTAATMVAEKKATFSEAERAKIDEFGAFYAFFFCKETNGGETARITAHAGNELAQVAKYMEDTFNSNAKKAKFGTDVYNFIKTYIASGVEETKAPNKSTVSQQFTDIPSGYYLVSDEAEKGTISALMMDTVTTGIKTIVIKVVEPSLEKTVHAVNNVVIDGDAEAVSAQVGDTVQFAINLDVPDYTAAEAANGTFWYHFKDQGAEGMTLAPESDWKLELYRDGEKVEDLVINDDYLILPASYADALDKLDNGTNAYRRILGQLIIHFFDHTNYATYADGNLTDLTNQAKTILVEKMQNEDGFNAFLGEGGGGIVFRLSTSDTFKPGDDIKIYIDAVINESAAGGNGMNANTATLRYASVSREHTPNPGNITEIDDDAKVYTHSLEMVKVAMSADGKYEATDTKLSGAKFKVYKAGDTVKYLHFVKNSDGDYNVFGDEDLYYKETAEAEATEATEAQIEANVNLYVKRVDKDKKVTYKAVTLVEDDEIEVASDGTLNVRGLSTGTYMFVETVAPAGYALPEAPLGITITATYTSSGTLNTLKGDADDGDTGNTHSMIHVTGSKADDSVIYGKITNALTKMLPSTGGNGAMLLTVFGSVGAVVMLAMLVMELKKKKA